MRAELTARNQRLRQLGHRNSFGLGGQLRGQNRCNRLAQKGGHRVERSPSSGNRKQRDTLLMVGRTRHVSRNLMVASERPARLASTARESCAASRAVLSCTANRSISFASAAVAHSVAIVMRRLPARLWHMSIVGRFPPRIHMCGVQHPVDQNSMGALPTLRFGALVLAWAGSTGFSVGHGARRAAITAGTRKTCVYVGLHTLARQRMQACVCIRYQRRVWSPREPTKRTNVLSVRLTDEESCPR